jgi:CheY-like chemotaxis protein
MPDTPLIGCSIPPRKGRATEAHAVDYLVKPVRRADLEKVVQAVGKPVSRVLIVDDDDDLVQLLTRMLLLSDEKLEVAVASSGQQALQAMADGQPDLVLLDILLPDMDGWQVLEHKNQDGTIRDIPVILVSAQDPMDQPLVSPALVASMGKGLPLGKLLRCALEISAILLRPDSAPDLASLETGGG